MKKVLLIIILTLCIFQMVVLATAIDIGSAAIDRGYVISYVYATAIDKNNPANDSGIIDTIEIWANVELADCKVATFFVVSGNNLSTRDYETVNNGNGAGVVLAGSKQTFTVNLDVEAGDYIGLDYTAGSIERGNTGGGYWIQTGNVDCIPCTNKTFTLGADRTLSIGGTGETEEEAENAIFFGMNF